MSSDRGDGEKRRVTWKTRAKSRTRADVCFREAGLSVLDIHQRARRYTAKGSQKNISRRDETRDIPRVKSNKSNPASRRRPGTIRTLSGQARPVNRRTSPGQRLGDWNSNVHIPEDDHHSLDVSLP